MRALRILHAATVLLAGFALMMLGCGFVRTAVAVLLFITCLQAWSLEMLRTFIGQRETRP